MSILVNINNIGGSITKEDDRYTVKDNTLLDNLVVSSTDLKPMKSTSGHNHKGQEEVYQFVSGNGTMVVGTELHLVGPNDVVLIPDGEFHRVSNTSKYEDLIFVCVFDGKRSH